MTRTPQPMRRMRYLIAEALRQGLVPDDQHVQLVRADSWMADEGVIPGPTFLFEISPRLGEWVMWLHMAQIPIVPVFGATLSTAPGPETVWIGPDLTPVTIQPRTTPTRETIRASILAT